MDNFYTQSFQDFASGVKSLDLALYAGAGLIVWVLFQEKLVGLKDVFSNLLGKIKLPSVVTSSSKNSVKSNDPFFQLVVSWKQTRDLAVQSGCEEAVKVADQMFPLLGPSVCEKRNKGETV